MGEILYFPTPATTARRRDTPPREQHRPAGPPETVGRGREPLLREAYGDVLRELAMIPAGRHVVEVWTQLAAALPMPVGMKEIGGGDTVKEVGKDPIGDGGGTGSGRSAWVRACSVRQVRRASRRAPRVVE